MAGLDGSERTATTRGEVIRGNLWITSHCWHLCGHKRKSVEAVECLRSWLEMNIMKGIMGEENSGSVVIHEDKVTGC